MTPRRDARFKQGVRETGSSPLARLARLVVSGFRDGRGGPLWLMGLATGVLAGYAVIGLRMAIAYIEHTAFGASEERLATVARGMEDWRLFLIPVVAGIIVAALLWIGEKTGLARGTRAQGVADLIQARAVENAKLPLGAGLYSALIAAVSLGGGGSAGREGPAVHLGGVVASSVARSIGLDVRAARILLACGAAAAVAASFNAPVAGALFAFEVVLGHYALRSIAPVAVASVTGALIASSAFPDEPAFSMPQIAPASIWDFPAAALLGIAAAGLAVIFVRSALILPAWAERRAKAASIPLWSLPVAGGIGLGAMGLVAPEILGVGYEATSTALEGGYTLPFLILLLVMKIIATATTLASRFGGGVFSPSLYLGAVLGAAFGVGAGAVLGDQTAGTGFFAMIGMGAVAGAVLGAPLSTTLIVFELTASYETAVAVLVAVSLATTLSQSAIGGSFFQKQIERRGYDLTGGSAKIILQTVRVRDFMSRIEGWEMEHEPDVFFYEDNTLGRVLARLEAEQLEGAAVKSRASGGDIIGWVSKADAQAAHARALAEAHEEEHR